MKIEDIAKYLKPIDGENPVGEDLYINGEIYKLEQLAKGREETQFAEAEPPNWKEVVKLAGKLLEKGKDLWAVLYLAIGIIENDTEKGMYISLKLVEGMLVEFWDNIYPQIEEEDEEPYRMRLSPLETFFSIRNIPCLTVKNFPLTENLKNGFKLSDYIESEKNKDKSKIKQIVTTVNNENNECLEEKINYLNECREVIECINSFILDKAGDKDNIVAFDHILELIDKAATVLQNGIVSDVEEEIERPDENIPYTGVETRTVTTGGISRREDIPAMLDKISSWIEMNEPANPASLFIQRAKSVFNKSFIEIIDDIAAGGREQVNTIFGSLVRDNTAGNDDIQYRDDYVSGAPQSQDYNKEKLNSQGQSDMADQSMYNENDSNDFDYED